MKRPADLAARMRQQKDDGFARESFTLPRPAARAKARELLDRYPSAAYMTAIEQWRELPDDTIEFTMKRLPTAD